MKDLVRRSLLDRPRDTPIDLYGALKDLSWDIFLAVFLETSRTDPIFGKIVKLQEELLRGQFSLFPASVNVGVWQSPRHRGVRARKKLQELITEIIAVRRPPWLATFDAGQRDAEEMVNHALMATSSLAVKGFASLLLAFLLNLFIYRHSTNGYPSLSDWIEAGTEFSREQRLIAVLNETLRLSPPIPGVMRRASEDKVVMTADEHDPNILIPRGFDVWCYFPGANRDPSVFGEDADLFRPARYLDVDHEPAPSTAFGHGQKSCLGATFARDAAVAVYEAFAESHVRLSGAVDNVGVRGLLGWQVATPQQWAEGVKQLPIQRPSEPIMACLQEAA